MRAVVLAGGGGTRLRPLTNATPKPMIEFMGRPYAVGLMQRLADAEVDRMDLLVGQAADAFEALVHAGRRFGVTVEVLTEERPLDTAGAARRLLRGSGDEAVLVCNGDVLSDIDYRDLRDRHRKAGATATIALTHVEDTSSFGVIERADDGTVTAFIEKPPPGSTTVDTVNAGTYVLDAAAFDPFPGDGPLSFERDVFPGLLLSGAVLHGEAYDVHWQDLGTPHRFLDGCRAVLEGRCRWPLPAGLEIGREAVAVHADARVAGGAAIRAATVVGADAHIGADAQVEDSVVMHGAVVGDRSVVVRSILGPGAHVAPGASVGPDEVVVAE